MAKSKVAAERAERKEMAQGIVKAAMALARSSIDHAHGEIDHAHGEVRFWRQIGERAMSELHEADVQAHALCAEIERLQKSCA